MQTGRFTPATGVETAPRACYKDINCCFSGVQRAIMSWNPEGPWEIITVDWGGHMAMDEQFVEATERAIDQLISDFQTEPNRFWNERDIDWSLFCYLKQQELFQRDMQPSLSEQSFQH